MTSVAQLSKAAHAGQLRALVVDDEPSFVRSLGRALSQEGFEVESATSGDEAIERLRHEHFDAMVLDLRVSLGGALVIEALRTLPEVPATIVVASGVDVSQATAAMRAGAIDVLPKPIDAHHVARRLKSFIPRESAPRGGPVLDPVERILGSAPQTRLIRQQIREVARFPDLSVLIVGETGTGKELVAEAIHELTAAEFPLVTLNCAAIPEQLFESELFGHEAGAFTGANGKRLGLLESAQRGTVFLDEVGEMPASLQPKLLRVLETRHFRRLGSNRDQPWRARVVSATNREIVGGVDRALRPDVYFRLAGVTIRTTPLRERPSDVAVLATHFLRAFAQRYPGAPMHVAPAALAALVAHAWPGNVRELRAVVEHAAVLARGSAVDAGEVEVALGDRRTATAPTRAEAPRAVTDRTTLRDLERTLIFDAFEACGANLSLAARRLGIPRTTLREKLKRYGLR